jgi:hypothetical protein
VRLCLKKQNKQKLAGCWWLLPVILATQEAKIRRIVVRSQPQQIVFETLPGKKNLHKKGLVERLKGVGPEFKRQYCKNKIKQYQKLSFKPKP